VLRVQAFAAALAAALFMIACPSGDVRLDVTPKLVVHYFKPSDERLLSIDAGAYVDLEYTWEVGPNFAPPTGDLRAFVHFRDSSGKLIEYAPGKTLQDDHDITPPPRKWKAGEDVVEPAVGVERPMFKIPDSIGGQNYIVTAYVGLYDPKTRHRAELTWSEGDQPKDRAYPVARFHVRRNREKYIYPEYDTTWNGPEPDNYQVRWSKKTSVATFRRYPKAEAAELILAGHSPAEDLKEPQELSIYIHEKRDDLLVAKIKFDGERVLPTRVPISKELFSREEFAGSFVKIIFDVDKILTPPEGDIRGELGFEFHELLLLPKDPES
jgi:hypothetical protein